MHSPATLDTNQPGRENITIRDRRFSREGEPRRWWCGGDPVATAWFTALSASFPLGETMFIDAVRTHRDGASADLAIRIRAFIRQEANHTREHLAFNRSAEQAGYDLTQVNARVERLIAMTYERAPIRRLAVTMALEHFTAMFAHEFLAHPEHFAGSEGEEAQLWRWHAVEEIEHKAVAFDTWSHATRGWRRRRRYKMRCLIMLLVSFNFIRHRSRDALDLLAQDGITGWRAKARLGWYLVGKPGILRRIFPAWLAYFRPGFHPWQVDDRELISRYDSENAMGSS